MRLSALLPISLVGFAALGCGSSTPDAQTPDPNNPCPPGQFCQQMVPTATATATAPAPTATATAAGGSTATPVPAIAAAAATPVLDGMSKSELPYGMQPESAPFAAQFQEGQTFEQPFNIQAGKCYSVIAVGLGIADLDVQIAAQPMPNMPPVVLAQDSMASPNVTLGGKKDGCWKNPTPLAGQGKVILKAAKGGGIGVAQIFVK